MESRSTHTLRFVDGPPLELGGSTAVMGVLNVTPDSFSDGGRFSTTQDAAQAAQAMFAAGAALVDVGGESTRPGAEPVSPSDELGRVIPVIQAIRARSDGRISIDTRRAEVARAAIEAGADLVNDISGLRDPDMLPLVASRGVPVLIMHMRGVPATMHRETHYDDVMGAVSGYLDDALQTASTAGVANDKILVDPGIGFGKSAAGSLTLLRRLAELRRLNRPIVVGASRKSFIGAVLDLPVSERMEGSLAIAALASAQGAHVIRAHDVTQTIRAVRMVDAVRGSALRIED